MTTTPMPRTVVLIAGKRWKGNRGADHRLAEALAAHLNVLWAEPPIPVVGPASRGRPPLIPGYALDRLGHNLLHLRVLAPPGITRPMVRDVASRLMGRAIRRTLAGNEPTATILMSPRDTFPHGLAGRRILHLTDDWPAGAVLMGLSRKRVTRTLQANAAAADAITVVSPHIAETVTALAGGPTPVVLPNGCTIPDPATSVPGRDHRAQNPPGHAVGLVGQLNERLDLDLLDRLAAAGLPIEVIGPRRERDSRTAKRLDLFLSRPNVRWLGEVPEAEVHGRLGTMAVGITPYAITDFNRASFPLKTLEYMAAGLPVVSTDLPAVRWLDSPLIRVGRTAQEFVDFVVRAQQAPLKPREQQQYRAFAREHSWDARARRMVDIIEGRPGAS